MSNNNETPLKVGGVVNAFIAEGATGVWSEVMRGLHNNHGHNLGVIALNNHIVRDGIDQPMTGDQYYNNFVRDGILVESLDKRDEGNGTLQTYTEKDLEQITSFAKGKDALTTLEEYPVGALNLLDTDVLPPIMVDLYRSGEFKTDRQIQDLLFGIKNGNIVGCTVDGDASKEAYAKRGVNPGNITVIYNGIDTERFVPSETERKRIRAELSIDAEAPAVLLIARDSPEKDIPLFMESAQHFLENSKNGHVLMVGTGLTLDNPSIAKLIDDKFDGNEVLKKRLHALGLRKDLPGIYAACDVLALTSMTESRPLCISEAQASGLGVTVSTPVGDAPSMIGTHGFLTGRDPEEIAARWQEAFDKRHEIGFPLERREELGKMRMISMYNNHLRDLLALPKK